LPFARPGAARYDALCTEAVALTESAPARRALVLGAATNWTAFAATLAVAFFLAPYLVRALGAPKYGAWCVAEGVLAYFTLFDLGIAACLVRFVARYAATGDTGERNRVVASCFALFCAAGTVALLVGCAVAPLVAPGIERKLEGDSGEVLPFLLLMLANLAVTLPLSVFPNVLDGVQRFGAKSAVRLVALAARVTGTVWVMETTPGLLPLALVFTVTNLAEHALMALLCYRLVPRFSLSLRNVDRASLRAVRGYSVDAFLAMLAGRVTVQTGAIVAGGFVSLAAAAHYALAARLVEMAKNLLRHVTTTLAPAVSAREAAGDLAGVRSVLLDGTRAVLYLVLPVHLGLLAFGAPFLDRWLGGAALAEACFPTTAILACALSLAVAQSVAARVLYGLGKLKLFARAALCEAALNLVLCFALVGEFGLVGIAVAVAVPNALFCVFTIAYACRVLEIPVREYARRCWLKPLCAALAPAAVWLLLPAADPTWGAIVLGACAGLGPYAVAVLALEFAPKRREVRAAEA
jgi:O-antigen/teichoic acid export membrane protein